MAFESLAEKLSASFKKLRGKGRLTEADIKEAMREVRLALLEADVNYLVVKDFIKNVSARAVGAEILESLTPGQQVIKIVTEELTALMGRHKFQNQHKPQGSDRCYAGRSSGRRQDNKRRKLAALMRKQYGKRPLLVACDIYRPAAISSSKTVGGQLDIPVFQMALQIP
jgi:signal recognition particle subunit SRP54